ncbi:hypothetical protein [Halalkalibaculum sp. DA384]
MKKRTKKIADWGWGMMNVELKMMNFEGAETENPGLSPLWQL